MTKRYLTYTIALHCFFLASCGNNPAISTTSRNAERFINDGIQAFSISDYKRAKWSFTRALSIYKTVDDQNRAILSYINLAEVTLSEHDYISSKLYLDKAQKNVEASSYHHYQKRITLLYAQIALQQKNIKQADVYLQTILPEFDETVPVKIPDPIQLAAIANQTKLSFIKHVDEDLWTLRFANSLTLSAETNPTLNLNLLRFQSKLLKQQGQYEKAELKLLSALSSYKITKHQPGIAATLLELGTLYIEQRRWQDAQDYLNRSLPVFRYLKDQEKISQAISQLAKVQSELDYTKSNEPLIQQLTNN